MIRLVTTLIVGAAIAACVRSSPTTGESAEWSRRMDKMNLVNHLWVQIREFRADAGMDLDPPASMELQWRGRSLKEAEAACPKEHAIPAPCTDTCVLAGHICDNAETICQIADELGKHDPAQEKCTSAKASCRQATQRCCHCVANPPHATTSGVSR